MPLKLTEHEKKINLFEIICIWICMCSGLGLLLLALQRFDSGWTIIGGSLTTVVLLVVCRLRMSIDFKLADPLLLLILVLALFFRFGPYMWVMGGQDQGLYFNMSAYFEKHGTSFVKDTVRQSLSEKSRLIYDRYCTEAVYGKERKVNLAGVYPITQWSMGRTSYRYVHHHPGIYVKDQDNSEYVFQFYHLHPIWMALFAKMSGNDNRAWSVVFFSLLSIVALYLLALELSRDRLAALAAALFLAVNPLHVFFAKFPLTETMALFFSAASFYLLVRFINKVEVGETQRWYLWLSAILAGGLFFTRISGFMYMVFYYAILLAILYRKRERTLDNCLVVYIISVMALFVVSFIYGLRYSFPYAMDTYNQLFSNEIVEKWRIVLPPLFIGLLVPVIWLKCRKLSDWVVTLSGIWVKVAIAAIFIMASYKAVGYYRAEGFSGLATSSMVVSAEYLSPILFLVLPVALYHLYGRSIGLWIVNIFLIVFMAFVFIGGGRTIYQYYYARYLLSEIVPYSLLIIAIYLALKFNEGVRGQRYLIVVVATCYLLYSIYFTSFQLKGREAEGAAKGLQSIAQQVDKRDILFVDTSDFQVITPLVIYYGLNVIPVSDRKDFSAALFREVASKYRNLYLLTSDKINNSMLEFMQDIGYRQGMFEHVQQIPRRFDMHEKQLLLYRFNPDQYPDIEKDKVF